MKAPFRQLISTVGLSRPADGAPMNAKSSEASDRVNRSARWLTWQPQKTKGPTSQRPQKKPEQTQAAVPGAPPATRESAYGRIPVRPPRARLRALSGLTLSLQETPSTQHTEVATQQGGHAAGGASCDAAGAAHRRPGTPDSFESTSSVGSVDAIYLRPRAAGAQERARRMQGAMAGTKGSEV
jgi:hypothetical protein